MRGIDRRLVQNFDGVLFGLVTGLVVVGLVNLASTTHTDAGMSDALRRQLLSLGMGMVALVATVAFDYRHYERLALPLYVGSLALIGLTLVVAPLTRGSQSWLFGGRVQPAEIAHIAMILMLARYFQRYPPGQTTRLRDLLWPGAIIAGPVGMIVLQRDLAAPVERGEEAEPSALRELDGGTRLSVLAGHVAHR